MGLIDIYVGGARDGTTGIVKNFAKSQEGAKYFEWNQRSEIVELINSQPEGEPINLIGHSYGGDTAAWAAIESCRPINSLTTIDPVSRQKPDYNKIKEKVGTWTNINAAPAETNSTDFIAKLGGKWGEGPKEAATTFKNVNANHGDFLNMLRATNSSNSK